MYSICWIKTNAKKRKKCTHETFWSQYKCNFPFFYRSLFIQLWKPPYWYNDGIAVIWPEWKFEDGTHGRYSSASNTQANKTKFGWVDQHFLFLIFRIQHNFYAHWSDLKVFSSFGAFSLFFKCYNIWISFGDFSFSSFQFE